MTESIFKTKPETVTVQLTDLTWDDLSGVLAVVFADANGRTSPIRFTFDGGYNADTLAGSDPVLSIMLPRREGGPLSPICKVNGYYLAALFLARVYEESSDDDGLLWIDAAKRLADREILIDVEV